MSTEQILRVVGLALIVPSLIFLLMAAMCHAYEQRAVTRLNNRMRTKKWFETKIESNN